MPVPEFPDFRPIELEDRTIISEVFEKTEPILSEFTFTNLFIWRYSYQFQVSFLDNILLILACPEPDKHFFMPPAGENITLEVLDTMLSFMLKEGWTPEIKRVPGELIDKLNIRNDDKYEIYPNREHFDYVYRTKNLIELRGKKLRKKKNHLNYLLRNFDFVFEPLTDRTIKHCFEMQGEWCNLKDCAKNPTLSSEDFAAFEALYHWKQLSINQVCCKNLWSGYEYINRKQDMGQKGLRQAKLSYNPAFLVEKYTITPGKNF